MDAVNTSATSIMVRARITPEEWTQFRKLALDLNEPSSAVVGELIRGLIAKHTTGKRGEK